MKKTLLSLFIACGLLSCNKDNTPQTADYNVIPLPQEVKMEQGEGFELNGNTVIVYNDNDAMKRNAELLAEYIKASTGLDLEIVTAPNSKTNTINLVIDNTPGNKEA